MRRPRSLTHGAVGKAPIPVVHLDPEQAIADLEREVAQLKDALQTRQQIGVAIGIFAQRFRCSPERAWSILVRVSQAMNVKVRDIAGAVAQAQAGQVAREDAELLARLSRHLPTAWRDVPGTKG